jgi:ligand-binding sensor domain-containing protein
MILSIFKKTLPCCIFITGSVFSFAQFVSFNTSNSGLPNNTVRCVAIDSANNVWAGTDFGLAKFDGTNWEIFNTQNSGLTDNLIRAIEFDSLGHLWVGTLIEGLFHYDGVSWTNYSMANSGLPDNQIKDIEFDLDGFLWVATTGGLAMYDNSVWTVWNVFNSSFPTNNISSIEIAPDNTKHIGAVNGGLQIISPDNLTVTTYWSYNSSLIDNTILSIDLATNGWLWMATPSGGIIVHVAGDNWIFYNTQTSDIPTNSATYILIDGNLKYIPTIDDGLLVYDGITFEQFNTTNSDIPDNYLYCINKDTAGIFWMGSYNGGLIKFDPSTIGINENLISSFSISSILQDGNNLMISFTENVARFEVCDLQGKLICSQSSSSKSFSVPINGLSGIFLFSFVSEKGIKITSRLFIP